MASKRGNLEVRLIVPTLVVEEQQLTPTPDAAIGTTRRGTLPPEFHAGSFFLNSVILSQTFQNLNSQDKISHRRASNEF